jgi:O-antigen/teichoic acid export membrane protein
LFGDRELARNTAWMLGGQIARTVIQAAYFVLVARSLQVDNYGAFVAASALIMVAAPFVSLGSGFIMIKHVSRDPGTFPRYWGNALSLLLASGGVMLVVTALVSRAVLPAAIPIGLVIALGVAELVCARITELAGQAFIAFRRVKWTATIQLALSVARLAAIAIVATCVTTPSALTWSLGYLAATAVAMLFALALVAAKLGAPRLRFDASLLELEEGLYFAVGLSAQTVYNDMDKSLLSRLASLDASGIYGAAYRIIDVCFAPISALIAAAYSDFFRRGATGLRGSLAVTRGLLPIALLYATVCSLALLAFAPVLPAILGDGYAPTVAALRWLAPIPVLRAIHYFLADAMSGAGHQRTRTLVQIVVAVVNVVLLVAVIPQYSWRGAAWVSLASDGLLVVGLAAAMRYLLAVPASRTTSS